MTRPASPPPPDGPAPLDEGSPPDAPTLPEGYGMTAGPPTAEEYVRLRASAGLSPRSEEQARQALAGTWAVRVVRLDRTGEAVAMGRVIGDGGWCFLVADMATAPGHQRRGLGAAVLDGLLAEVAARAPGAAHLTLTADPPGRALYASRGFTDVAPARTGMHLALP